MIAFLYLMVGTLMLGMFVGIIYPKEEVTLFDCFMWIALWPYCLALHIGIFLGKVFKK